MHKNVDFKELLDKTDKFTGADIESLSRGASILAIRELIDKEKGKITGKKLKAFTIKEKHFEEAVKAIKKER